MVALAPLAPAIGRLALAAGGAELTRQALRSFGNGAAFQAGAELVYQIAEWARSIDGNWDSEGLQPGDGNGPTEGCWKVEGGAGLFEERESSDVPWGSSPGAECNVVSASASFIKFDEQNGLNSWSLSRTYSNKPSDSINISRAPGWQWRINPACSGGTCSTDPYPGSGEPAGPIDLGPVQAGDCTINVTFMGFMGNEDGSGKIDPVYYIEPAQTRASGGVIVGECNFQPTVMVGGGGDGEEPPRTYPSPPREPGGDDWWSVLAKGLIAGVTAAVVNRLLDALLTQQGAASYTLVAPCDEDEEGEPLTYTVEFPQQDAQQRLLSWQVAQADLLQQHLNWKTPICKPERPPLEGEWITTRWQSDEVMDHSGRRLRKLFRYRSKSSRELQQLSSYWESFVWRSGNVCVIHKDAWWGTPQVWAESAEEGKRVLRFAGAEAGLDPDQVGRWIISGSRSPRPGMSGTMRVLQHKGFPWVASRDGADWPNVLAKEA